METPQRCFLCRHGLIVLPAPAPEQAPKGRAVADKSRQFEAQTSPSTKGAAPANAPEVTSNGGLTSDEARRRLTKFGPNAIPDTSVHPLRMAVAKFWTLFHGCSKQPS